MTMVGPNHLTKRSWIVHPPSLCPNGHKLLPGKTLVGNQPCGGAHGGSHLTWSCDCGGTVYAPALGSACRVLHGAAGVRE